MSLRLATCWRPVRMTFSAYWRTSRLWCSASPSQASGTQSEPGHRQRLGVEQRAQVGHGELRRALREPLAQRGRGQRDGVQRGERRALQRRRELVARASPGGRPAPRPPARSPPRRRRPRADRSARRARGYLTRRDSRRSANARPWVWQVGQYWKDRSAYETSRTVSPHTGTRQPGARVHPHPRALLALETRGVLADGALHRVGQHPDHRGVQPVDRLGVELARRRERRQLRDVQDLVGVGVADAGEHLLVDDQRLEPLGATGEQLAELTRGRATARPGRAWPRPGPACGSVDEVHGEALLRARLGEVEARARRPSRGAPGTPAAPCPASAGWPTPGRASAATRPREVHDEVAARRARRPGTSRAAPPR